ncbi:nuclear transport factor 2 family protein [Nocardioides sp.]|uniref:nuclear transport factor 2 family protein n=1 Tax=Nocardioides sp. TaxID=35761 RepID=UPI003512362F
MTVDPGTADPTPLQERLTALEDRVRHLEDHAAIVGLLASYGPLVDAGDLRAAQVWAEDGRYDVEGWAMGSQADVAAMIASPAHQGLIATGAVHLLGAPAVTVDGDTAVAVCHSLLLRHREGGFEVWRAAANRIDLVRTGAGWRIAARTTRPLDGREESRALLASLPPPV